MVDYDPIWISMTILSWRSQFWSNFDLISIKINLNSIKFWLKSIDFDLFRWFFDEMIKKDRLNVNYLIEKVMVENDYILTKIEKISIKIDLKSNYLIYFLSEFESNRRHE